MMWLGKVRNKAVNILTANNNKKEEISFVDVKELYDAAFAEKSKARVNLKRFKALMSNAERLDALYRYQIAELQTKPFEYQYNSLKKAA